MVAGLILILLDFILCCFGKKPHKWVKLGTVGTSNDREQNQHIQRLEKCVNCERVRIAGAIDYGTPTLTLTTAAELSEPEHVNCKYAGDYCE